MAATITMDDLPVEVLDLIMRKLLTEDVLKCCQLNRKFARLINEGEYLFDGPNVLKKLIDRKRVDLVGKYLERPDVDPSIDDDYAIIKACQHGNLDMVKILLAHPRINVEIGGSMTLIRHAGFNDSVDVVEYLLSDSRIEIECGDIVNAWQHCRAKCFEFFANKNRDKFEKVWGFCNGWLGDLRDKIVSPERDRMIRILREREPDDICEAAERECNCCPSIRTV